MEGNFLILYHGKKGHGQKGSSVIESEGKVIIIAKFIPINFDPLYQKRHVI